MESDTTQSSSEPSLADVVQLLQRQDTTFRAELDMIRQDMVALAARLPAGEAPEPLLEAEEATASDPAPFVEPQAEVVEPVEVSVEPAAASMPLPEAVAPEPIAPVAVAPVAAPIPVTPPQPVPDVQPIIQPAGTRQSAVDSMHRIIFGQDLAPGEMLADCRHELLNGLLETEATATTLAGQILIFRAAPTEKLPQLLKDVGEAYYRWKPAGHDDNDPMRDALIFWLHSRCEAGGMGNKIVLIRMSDRYDSKRHNAKERGVEVIGVHGWIVLRDNGKVYTKGNVSVR
jgi:hypothetical protein